MLNNLVILCSYFYNMKKILLITILPITLLAQIPTGYYNGTEGLSGYALKSKLHEIISKQIFSYSYSQVGGLYASTDLDKYYENDNTILDIYSEIPNAADAYNYNLTQNISSSSSEGLGWNKEHGMPQSTYYGIYPMYSDIHYLIPADARINQLRSNFPYARNNGAANNCNSPNTTPCTASNGSKLGKSTTPGYTNTVYEPIDEFKGDVARYLLYFVTRYEGRLNAFNYLLSTSPLDGSEEKGYEDWYITMLKEWNTLDPVSQKEIDRNNAVYAIEKIRNPFIDHPEWVDLIWSETTDAIAPQAPTNLSVSNIGESFLSLSWSPSQDADVLGYKIYVNGVYTKYSKTSSTTIDRLIPSTVYNITVKAYDKGYLLSTDSNVASATTLASDGFAKDLMITKYIEGTTSSSTNTYNTTLEITNLTGHDVELKNYYLNIQFKSSNTYYFSDAYELEGTLENGKSVVIINPKSNFSNFSPSQAKFVTNSTPMTFTGSQYVELSYGTKYLKTVSTNNYNMSYVTVDAVGTKDISNTNGNKSLYRNTNIKDPNINFTIAEWTEYPMNYSDGLGTFLATETPENPNIEISVYPNPVTDIINVKGNHIDKISKVQIFDIAGKLIAEYDKPFSYQNTLDLSKLSPGIYVIKLDNISQKIIKK